MTNKPNVTSKYEEERLRTQEQSQIVYLQGQLDDLLDGLWLEGNIA